MYSSNIFWADRYAHIVPTVVCPKRRGILFISFFSPELSRFSAMLAVYCMVGLCAYSKHTVTVLDNTYTLPTFSANKATLSLHRAD